MSVTMVLHAMKFQGIKVDLQYSFTTQNKVYKALLENLAALKYFHLFIEWQNSQFLMSS